MKCLLLIVYFYNLCHFWILQQPCPLHLSPAGRGVKLAILILREEDVDYPRHDLDLNNGCGIPEIRRVGRIVHVWR